MRWALLFLCKLENSDSGDEVRCPKSAISKKTGFEWRHIWRILVCTLPIDDVGNLSKFQLIGLFKAIQLEDSLDIFLKEIMCVGNKSEKIATKIFEFSFIFSSH